MPKSRGKKVFVALSGGVDSSVSAGLLKDKGYDVTGVFIRAWNPDFMPCSWREERRDAMRVAVRLKIPFLTFDLEKEYKKDVVDYLIREYRLGRTPNPDVMCNKEVKFGAFYKKAKKMGADFIATGHYARVAKNKSGETALLTAKDREKDQTYFLWGIKQKVLKNTLFPIGEFQKNKVRKLAKKFRLFTATKKDSQGVCFVGELNMKEFLAHYIKPKKGRVVFESGEVIGYHHGAWFFTGGERHGFVVTNEKYRKTPLYIIKKNAKKNVLTVSHKRTPKTYTNIVKLDTVNLIAKQPNNIKAKVRFRYREPLVSCKARFGGVKAKLDVFSTSSLSSLSTVGQSAVLYRGEECIGGGIIS